MASHVTVGKVFGQLTVLQELERYVEPNGRKRPRFLVRCSCGFEFTTLGIYLTRTANPRCRQCAANSRRIVHIDDRLDQLTVIGFTDEGTHQRAICRCDCGGTVNVRPTSLVRNKTNNCGCAVRGKWKGMGRLSLTYFNRTKRGARKRGLSFKVTMPYLWRLYENQNGLCALTRLPIPMPIHLYEPTEASLDRVDSSKGYTEENVQWVHKDIQRMKSDLSPKRFTELCQLVAQTMASTISMQSASSA